ncbi:MAG: T9SS C-terminal target domain-containing protein [Saprospirales bacterium]|nr:MAG: T9SS C-terminal target domain-containing protein [Saprospirales bacterium]
MNQFMRIITKLSAVLLTVVFLNAPQTGISQTPYQTNQILVDSQFYSQVFNAFSLFIISHPSNGSATRINSPGARQMRYTPNPGFIGRDSVSIEVHYTVGANPNIKWYHYEIEVKESIVWINDLEIAIPANSGWHFIDLMGNDSSTSDSLQLSNISAVNRGFLEISNDSVFFKPISGFNGMGYIKYTACDEYNECGSATAHINIVDSSNVVVDGNLHLHTFRNRSVRALLPSIDYEVDEEPELGTVTPVGNTGIWEYKPIQNVTGEDSFKFQLNEEFFTTVYVTIHDIDDPNTFLVDDFIYTPKNTSVEFNVLENDLKNNINIQSFSAVTEGTLTHLGNGNFLYQPDSNFTGQANFTYRVCILGNCETARVAIFVGNLNPQNNLTYKLTTTKNRPLVINYEVPISNFMFHITQSPEFGALEVYPGIDTITIGCRDVRGNNLVVYEPNQDFVGLDEFELEYCVDGQLDCQVVKIEVEVLDLTIDSICVCIDDCVWPGDVNYDGKVDMRDLLSLGWYIGSVGISREDVDLVNWYGQSGDDWVSNQVSGENLKHADTDGDGLVSAADTFAISNFYNKVHTLLVEERYEHRDFAISLVEASSGPYYAGDLVRFYVVAGSESNPAMDLHGIAMSYNFNNTPFDFSNLHAVEYPSSWLTYDGPSLFMDKGFDNQLDFALTRMDGIGAIGFGIITEVGFIIEDDIDGFRRFPGDEEIFRVGVSLNNVTGFFAGAREYRLPETSSHFDIIIPGREMRPEFSEDLLHLFPNPAGSSDQIQLHLNGGYQIKSIELYDMKGRPIMKLDDIYSNRHHFTMDQLATGLYLIRVTTDAGPVTKKLQWIAE